MKKYSPIIFLLLAFLFLLPTQVWATTYYVDSSSAGSCDGLSAALTTDGSGHCAFKTVAEAQAGVTGDQHDNSVLFNRTQAWREQFTVGAYGTSGHPLTIGAYGSGALPIISGANLVTSWTLEAFATENFLDGTGSKPISWWTFSEASGDRIDGNITNNNDLTPSVSDPGHTTGPNGITDAVALVSASSQTLTSTNAALSANFPGKGSTSDVSVTAGAWVRIDSGTSAGIMNKRGHSWAIFYQSSALHFAVYNDAHDAQVCNSNGNITAGTWFHVVGRWNIADGEVSIFVNGAKQTSTASAATMSQDTDYFMIGGSSTWGYVNGAMAEAFVFAESLTDAQILDIYNGHLGGLTLNTYYATAAANPNTVIENGVAYRKIATDKTTLSVGSFWFDDPNDRVYVRTTGDTAPSNYTMEVPVRDNVVLLSGKDYVTLSNLKLTGARNYGLNITGAVNTPVMSALNITNNGHEGININGGASTIQNVSISACDISYHGKRGINGSGTITGINLSLNSIHHNAQQPYGTEVDTGGIYLYGAGVTNAIVEHNSVYLNGTVSDDDEAGYGIWYDTVGAGGIIRYNKSYSNSKGGILIERSSGVQAYYNLSYNNGYGHILVLRDVHDNLIYNNSCYGAGPFGIYVRGDETPVENGVTGNIFKNNISTGSSLNLRVKLGGENDGTYGSGNIYANNDFGPEGANYIEWGAGSYKSTLATFNAVADDTSGGGNNIAADPLLLNPSGGNFRPRPGKGSPVGWGAGTVIAGVTDAAGCRDYAGNTCMKGGSTFIGAYGPLSIPIGNRRMPGAPVAAEGCSRGATILAETFEAYGNGDEWDAANWVEVDPTTDIYTASTAVKRSGSLGGHIVAVGSDVTREIKIEGVAPGSGWITLEFWIYHSAVNVPGPFFGLGLSDGTPVTYHYLKNTGKLQSIDNGTFIDTATLSATTWTKIEVELNLSQTDGVNAYYIYVEGTQYGPYDTFVRRNPAAVDTIFFNQSGTTTGTADIDDMTLYTGQRCNP